MYSVANDILSACWIIFTVVWAFAAIATKQTVYRESAADRLRYMAPIILAFFLLFRGRLFIYPLSARIVPHADAIALVAAILSVFGLACCLWARAVLGRNWSGTVTLKEGHELITRGPYAVVRHPIYTGLLAMFVASALMNGHLAGIIGLVLGFLSFWIKLGNEERVMLKQFPDQYAAYQQRTKRIIPYLL